MKKFPEIHAGLVEYSRLNLTSLYKKDCQDDPLLENEDDQQLTPEEKSANEEETAPKKFDPSYLEIAMSDSEDEEERVPKKPKRLSGLEKAEAMADEALNRWRELNTRKERTYHSFAQDMVLIYCTFGFRNLTLRRTSMWRSWP